MRSTYFSKVSVSIFSALFFLTPLVVVYAQEPSVWEKIKGLFGGSPSAQSQSVPNSGQSESYYIIEGTNPPPGKGIISAPAYKQDTSGGAYQVSEFPSKAFTKSAGPGRSTGSGQFLINPLKYDTLGEVIRAILGVVSYLGFFIAIFFVIYSGFLFVTAQGNVEKITEARNNFKWTIIGVAILLGAQALAYIVEATVNQITR